MHAKPTIWTRCAKRGRSYFNKFAIIGTMLVAIAAVTGGIAEAAIAGGGPANHAQGCIVGQQRVLQDFFVNSTPNCGKSTPVNLGTTTQGTKGDKGDTGATGAQGPSGVVSENTSTGSGTLAHIGGSWSAGHTAVKTVSLEAGTYLVTLTGDFYKTATTEATPVLQIQLNGANHQLTGYTGAFPYNAAEATGVGSDGTPNGLEQTATAYGVVTLASAGDVEVDAFGYNPDRSGSGAGDFGVNATISFIKVVPAS